MALPGRLRGPSEESSTVVVGMAPPLEDVISGASTEKPFDLESFTAYARKKFFVENLVFIAEVDSLRQEQDVRVYESRLRHIMSEFVLVNAPSEVNLSDMVRKETENDAGAVLKALAQDSSAEPDRTCLDQAYKAIISLVRADQYTRYTHFILVQRQIRVSRLEALWWKQEGLTLKTFFTFPSPVNSADSRLHACITAFIVPCAAVLSYFEGFHWLWVYVTYGFLARVVCGPRLDPQAYFVLFVLSPLVADKLGLLKNEFKAGSPKRFAQGVGLIFAGASTALAFLGMRVAMVIVAACLCLASFSAGFCDVCIACEIFLLAARANLLPQSACEDCSVRFIKGKGTPVSANVCRNKSLRAASNESKLSAKAAPNDIEVGLEGVSNQVLFGNARAANQLSPETPKTATMQT